MREVVKDIFSCAFCVLQIVVIDTVSSLLYDMNKFVILIGYPSPLRYLFIFISIYLFHRYSPFRWQTYALIPFVIFVFYALLMLLSLFLSEDAHIIYGVIYNINVFFTPLWAVINSNFLVANSVISYLAINVIGICMGLWLVLYIGLHVFNRLLSKLMNIT